MLDQVLTCSAIGDSATVAAGIEAFVERTGADELMVTSQIYDHGARLRSYEIVAEAMGQRRPSEGWDPRG
jgi:alkanesulfonate monooxygenase SsuD/methylene tetrahydromethanopterin reductase-like flavin-dependent oxidoreductase (luciferase family)